MSFKKALDVVFFFLRVNFWFQVYVIKKKNDNKNCKMFTLRGRTIPHIHTITSVQLLR